MAQAMYIYNLINASEKSRNDFFTFAASCIIRSILHHSQHLASFGASCIIRSILHHSQHLASFAASCIIRSILHHSQHLASFGASCIIRSILHHSQHLASFGASCIIRSILHHSEHLASFGASCIIRSILHHSEHLASFAASLHHSEILFLFFNLLKDLSLGVRRREMAMYWILVTLSMMSADVKSSLLHPCPVAYVGESYKSECSGMTTERRFIVWTLEDKENQTSEEIKDDRDTVITCVVIDEALSEQDVIMTCRLPVFDFTLPPSCRASLIMPNVSFVCVFHKVHPKVKCEFGYDKNEFQPEVSVDYVVNPLTPFLPDYYNITCKGLLKLKKNNYQTIYFVRFSPIFELGFEVENNKILTRVQEVTLKFSPRVVINSPSYISLCPPNVTRNVTVYCSATSSSQKIKLHLFVDNDKVIPQKPPTMKDGKLYITMQEYTLEVDRHFRNRSLRCQRGRFSNDTARIDVFVPPASNPLFVLNGGMVINQITVIPGDARLSITCLVNKGTPRVSNISVVCYFVNGTRFLDKHNSSNLVIFTIYVKSLSVESNCICTAQHISGCYDEKASLKISINGTKENHVQSEDTTDYKSIIYITVIILLLIIIIAMSVFILRHRKAFYYYYLYKKYYVRIPEGCNRFGSAIHFYKYVSSFKVPKPNPPPPRRLAPSCPSDIDTEDLASSSEVK
ncbi:hypothetical protein BgiMline_035684 [Biomphalaria glabrata]|nr:hypothetical protein BgiMline_030983 [Biomphalaria glabrata]